MQQFITYTRVSTSSQGTSGLGLAAQDRDIRLYLETYAVEPHEVLQRFVEVVSGKSVERPVLEEALTLARQTGALLLVAKLDRLSRKVSMIATLMEDPKLSFKVASMPSADHFQLHIYAALAEQEREFISLRTKSALAEAKAKGVKLGGLRDKTDKRNVAVQQEARRRAERVRELVTPMRDQGASLRAIAEALNRSGVSTARGGQWQASQVQRTLARLSKPS